MDFVWVCRENVCVLINSSITNKKKNTEELLNYALNSILALIVPDFYFV